MQLNRSDLTLDGEEYYHLALHASSVGDHHACLKYLRKVLRKQPCDPWALYLRATQYAELGLIERAIGDMETALSIEPRIELARFQLGLLLLQKQRPVEAKRHLAALNNTADAALRMFCDALIAIADDDLCLARKILTENLSQISGRSPSYVAMLRLLKSLTSPSAVQ